MANEALIINGIERKIKKIIEINHLLRSENDQLRQEVKRRDHQLLQLEHELESKQNELVKISLAKVLEKELGVEESKAKLEALIAEIDQCIDVLSD